MASDRVAFFLNGRRVELHSPAPDLLLIDYLRSPEVGLTGAKKGCGQGGCGACTVILSRWDAAAEKVVHRSINSCLRPVCALDGLSVTTVEGTSGVDQGPAPHMSHQVSYSRMAMQPHHELPELAPAADEARAHLETRADVSGHPTRFTASGPAAQPPDGAPHVLMNPVAHRLAMNNGTQCGYCTTGFVMNMSALLASNQQPTQRQIEDVFDGNLCRCTGYRPILTGMKTFASDWTPEDEKERMKCLADDPSQTQPVSEKVIIPFPESAKTEPAPVSVDGNPAWTTPVDLQELARILSANRDKKVRMVHGNTSFGIYKQEYEQAELLVDIRLVPDLYGWTATAEELQFGAATTYSELIEGLASLSADSTDWTATSWGALEHMARRTAGTIVRNAATVGGNTMLVLEHIHRSEPFPSDLLTALVAVGARVEYLDLSTGKPARRSVEDLVEACAADAGLSSRIVLVRYEIPSSSATDTVCAQKVALREINSHSLVNATSRLRIGPRQEVQSATLVFGGIAPFPWRARKTEEFVQGAPLSLQRFGGIAQVLRAEVAGELATWRDRMAGLPDEGISDEYRVDLAVAFAYRAIVNALLSNAPDSVPPDVRSAGEFSWGRWPVSRGIQRYEIQDWKAPVSQPYVKIMSMYQASGLVHYTHEIPVPPTAVNAAFVLGTRALANFFLKIPGNDAAASREDLCRHLQERFPEFVDLVTHEQVPPGGMNLQGMGSDQPLFAVDRISYVGQAIALAIAPTEQQAIRIAEYVTTECIGYQPVDWPAPWDKPVLSLDKAIALGSVFPDYPASAPFVSHIWRIVRPGSSFEWVDDSRQPLDREPSVRSCRLGTAPCEVVETVQSAGGQVHFYMETQSCVATPLDAGRMLVQPSTQSPMEMHQTSSMALGVQANRVEVRVRQVGGGYGGKTEPARFVAGPAAVAAQFLKRPVRLVLPRESDSALIGKRHPYYGSCQIAIDTGSERPEDKGIIRGFAGRMWGDGGAFYDCSFIVSNCIQMRADNAYKVDNFSNQIDVCRTNTAPNTAFRAFGDIQGKLITENAIADAAWAVGMRPEEVREKNLYERGDVTPFGQALSYCYMRQVWHYLKEVCKYNTKLAAVEKFNAQNKWRKRGIAMVPVKYGSGYNFVQIEQAAAHLAVYSSDGSIVINQGGVDMGQGLITKAEQVASYILNVPFDLIHVDGPDTRIVPNPTSSGASTGTTYSAEAVKQICEILRARMSEFGYSLLRAKGEQWCRQNHVDFWNYGDKGWAAEVPGPGAATKLIWQNLVQQAYAQRIDLTVAHNVPMHGGETPTPALAYKPMDQQKAIPGIAVDEQAMPGGAVDNFTGFTYSAACSVVEVDILTGETKVLSSDLVYDIGWSLNAALDVGQVEGAFVQGIGYVLTEYLVHQPDGEEQGRLNTLNTWRYKPPATTTIPLELNTYLFPRSKAPDVPDNPSDVLSSKEVGEPPLVLATTVFFAVKDAVRASRVERKLSGLFTMDSPATVQEVRRACEVGLED